MPSLLTLPDVAMKLILEKSNFRSIQCLRKSCRDLRNFIDDVRQESNLSHLEVFQESDTSKLLIFFRLDKQFSEVVYQQHENGCSMKFNETEKYLENANFLEVACTDIKYLMDSTSSLNRLDIEAIDSNFKRRFLDILRGRKQKIKVNYLYISALDLNQVTNFLRVLDSLEKLKLMAPPLMHSTTLDISKLYEHWTHLKLFKNSYFQVDIPIENMIHFEDLHISVKQISLEMVLGLKEYFLRFSHMSQFTFNYNQFNSDLEHLIQIFGQPQSHYWFFEHYWIFEIPSEPENVLRIVWNPTYEVNFSFTRMDVKDVPNFENVVAV